MSSEPDNGTWPKHGLWDMYPPDRVAHYEATCNAYHLESSTQPFDWYDIPARVDEAYPIDGGPEVAYPRPRELKLYANESFVAQMIAKHKMWIDQISTKKDEEPAGFLCQARISAPGHHIGQGYNGLWTGGTEREAVVNAVSEGVTQLAFHMAPGFMPVEYYAQARLIPGSRQVVINSNTGQVVAKHSIPPLMDQLREIIETEGRFTWEQFQAMVSDATLDKIEGDIEAAWWDAYLLLSVAGEVDGFMA